MKNFQKRLAGLSLGLLMALGVGAAGGQHGVLKTDAAAPEIAKLEFTGTKSETDANAIGSYTTTWTEGSFAIANFNNNRWTWQNTDKSAYIIKCGRQKYDSVATISNYFVGDKTYSAIDNPLTGVESVVVNINNFNSSKGSIKENGFYVVGSASNDFSNPVTVTKNAIAKGENAFTDAGFKTCKYFKVVFDCGNLGTNGSNGFIELLSVTFLGESTDPTLTFDEVPTSAFDIDKNTEKDAFAYTTKNITTVNTATWSTSDENVVTIDSTTGKFKTVGGGTATITLSLTYDDATEPLTASAVVNVNYSDALTVDEAYAKISALTTSDTTLYTASVKGKAETVYPSSATTDESSYYVNFKTTDGNIVQVFYGAYMTTAPEGFDRLLVGSTITFKGNFQKYTNKSGKTTAELVNPTIVSVEYDATIYATYFVSTLNAGACADPTKDNTEALKTAWTDLKAKWAYVDSTSKGTLKTATTEDATYGEFAKKYDHIMTRYGEAKLGEGANFVGRGITSTPSGARATLASADNSLTITIIVLVSVLSISLIVGTSLIVRKRKVN